MEELYDEEELLKELLHPQEYITRAKMLKARKEEKCPQCNYDVKRRGSCRGKIVKCCNEFCNWFKLLKHE